MIGFINGQPVDLEKNGLPLKRELTGDDELNQIAENGIYPIQGNEPKNSPYPGSSQWATLIVIKHDNNQVLQFWLLQRQILHRWIAQTGANGSYEACSEWLKFADTPIQNGGG